MLRCAQATVLLLLPYETVEEDVSVSSGSSLRCTLPQHSGRRSSSTRTISWQACAASHRW